MAAVAAKRYAPIQNFFPKVYSSCQNIGNRHCFLVGGGGGGGGGGGAPDGFPPLFEKSCMKPCYRWSNCMAAMKISLLQSHSNL